MNHKLLLVALVLSGCEPNPDMAMRKSSPGALARAEKGQQFEITRVGVFKDDLAYSGKRGIYVIRDMGTGREYVGVSGVGISELASHRSGKTSVQDER